MYQGFKKKKERLCLNTSSSNSLYNSKYSGQPFYSIVRDLHICTDLDSMGYDKCLDDGHFNAQTL